MKEKNKFQILIFLFLLLDILIFFFLIFPAFREIKKDSEQLLLQKKKFARYEAELAKFQNFESEYKNYLDNLKEMEKMLKENLFIEKDVPTEFINFCQKEAQRENLQIQITPIYRFDSQIEEKKEPFNSLNIEIIIEGVYPNLLRFLKRVENSQWLLEAQRLMLTKEKEKIRANLLLKIYAKN